MKPKPSKCSKCPLFSTGVGFVPPSISRSPQLLICGQAPGHNELDAAKPFVGKAGNFLRYSLLVPAGVDPNRVTYDNALRCLFRNTSGAYPNEKEGRTAAEKCCRQYDIWHKFPSTPLLLMGNEAGQLFFPEITVGNYHGDIRRVNGRVIGLTYHPSAVLREPNFKPLVIQETYNLIRASYNPSMLDHPKIKKFVPTPKYLKFNDDFPCLTTDLEWDENQKVTVIGFCDSFGNAYSSFDVKEGIELLKYYITSTKVIISGHNLLNADIPVLGKKIPNIPIERTFDTMNSFHTLHPHFAKFGLLDLGSMVRFMRPTTDWKEQFKRAKGTDERTITKTLDYNGRDCYYPASIIPVLVSDLNALNLWDSFMKTQKLSQIAAKMFEKGIKINREALFKYAKSVVAFRQKEKGSFPFNPDSHIQGRKWIEENCGISVKSYDIDELNKHYGKHPELDRLINYRDGLKPLKTWFPVEVDKKTGLVVDVGEWIYPWFHATGTQVFRFSSSNPNFQNLPRPFETKTIVRNGKLVEVPNKLSKLRQFIIPRSRDFLLYCFDYAQIENRTVAWEASCQSMLDAFNSGVDFHRLRAAMTYHKQPEDVTKAERNFGKTVVHAASYGETDHSLADRLRGNQKKASIKEAHSLRMDYFNQYPEIPAWQQHVAALVEREEPLINAFGRRRQIYERGHDGLKKGCHYLGCSDAADIIGASTISIHEELGFLPIMIVHDELVFEFERGTAGLKKAKKVKAIMERPVAEMDNMVFPVECKIGENYSELEVTKI